MARVTQGSGTIKRTRCPACGTEQEAANGAAEACCLICGRSLYGDAGRGTRTPEALAVPASGASEVFDLPEKAPEEPDADIPEEAPVSRTEEVEQLLALERRTTSLLALIPLWGTWRIWTSESHGLFERIVLAGASILLTAAITVAVYEALPDAEDLAAAAADRTETDLERLEELLRQYRREYGRWPGPTTWSESIRPGDPRFHDPWGRPYLYERTPEGSPVVGTLGQDGLRGGNGVDRDVFRTVGETSR